MGGDGPTTFDRVLEYSDGWMPVVGRMGTSFADKMALLQRTMETKGRRWVPPPDSVPKGMAAKPREFRGYPTEISGFSGMNANIRANNSQMTSSPQTLRFYLILLNI
jgi:hypothetical protein